MGEYGTPLEVADPSNPDLVHLLSVTSHQNFSVPSGMVGAGPLVAQAPAARSTVVSAARLPAKQRRVRHLRCLALRATNHMSSQWRLRLSVDVACLTEAKMGSDNALPTITPSATVNSNGGGNSTTDTDAMLGSRFRLLFEATDPSHTSHPHWEVDGDRLAKRIESCAERMASVRLVVSADGGTTEWFAASLALSELVFFGVELSESHVRFPPLTLVVELVDGFYCLPPTLEWMALHEALPTVPPPKTVTGDSYSLAEFVSLIQHWQSWRSKSVERVGLHQLLDEALDGRGAMLELEGAQQAKQQRLRELRERRAELRSALEQQQHLNLARRAAVEALCNAVVHRRGGVEQLTTLVRGPASGEEARLAADARDAGNRMRELLRSILRELRTVYIVTVRPRADAATDRPSPRKLKVCSLIVPGRALTTSSRSAPPRAHLWQLVLTRRCRHSMAPNLSSIGSFVASICPTRTSWAASRTRLPPPWATWRTAWRCLRIGLAFHCGIPSPCWARAPPSAMTFPLPPRYV